MPALDAFEDVLWFLIVLGAVMLVHEFGHYVAARLLGIRVVTFSIGLGPRLFAVHRGKTEFRISSLPFGSYVAMAEKKSREETSPEKRTFVAKSHWQWLLVAIAGPLATVVLAVGLLTGLFMFHYREPSSAFERSVVGDVVPNSPATRAGIMPNDRDVKLDDIDNPTWDDLTLQELTGPDILRVAIERDGRRFGLVLTPDRNRPAPLGPVGWIPLSELQIVRVVSDMPAAKAGIREGDVLSTIDGRFVRSRFGLQQILEEGADRELHFTYERGNRQPPLS